MGVSCLAEVKWLCVSCVALVLPSEVVGGLVLKINETCFPVLIIFF